MSTVCRDIPINDPIFGTASTVLSNGAGEESVMEVDSSGIDAPANGPWMGSELVTRLGIGYVAIRGREMLCFELNFKAL